MSKRSRGHRRDHDEEHEEHENHEAWAIPYADMLTLLMALFVVMFATSRADTERFEEVAQSLRNEFGGRAQLVSLGAGGDGILDGGRGPDLSNDRALMIIPWADPGAATAGSSQRSVPNEEVDPIGGAGDSRNSNHLGSDSVAPAPTDADIALAVQRQAHEFAERAYEELLALRDLVELHAIDSGLESAIDFRVESRGLVVSIVTDHVLFEEASAALPRSGAEVLDIVARPLGDIPNRIAIEGHSDSRPITTARFPSNWELSSARAASVLRYFVERHGLAPDRLTATGYADTRPIASEANAIGRARNRRVEIVVLSTVSLDPLFAEAQDAGTGG